MNNSSQAISQWTEYLLAQIPFFLGLTWKAASEKAAVVKSIEAVKTASERELSLLDKNLSLLALESQTSRSSLDEKISGQGRRFAGKFERIESSIERLELKIDKLLEKN